MDDADRSSFPVRSKQARVPAAAPGAVEKAVIFVRSLLFALALLAITLPYGVIALLTYPFAAFTRHRIISG